MDPTKGVVPAAVVPAAAEPTAAELSARRSAFDGEPPVMTVESVARVFRVNRKTLYEMVRAKAIPGIVKFGRVIRFSRDALQDWFEGRRSRPKD